MESFWPQTAIGVWFLVFTAITSIIGGSFMVKSSSLDNKGNYPASLKYNMKGYSMLSFSIVIGFIGACLDVEMTTKQIIGSVIICGFAMLLCSLLALKNGRTYFRLKRACPLVK